MLIVALVLAVIGLAALVTAVVTSNELIAWVCIAASVIGVLLLIVDALRERSRGSAAPDADATDEPEPDVVGPESEFDADYPEDPEDPAVEEPTVEEPAVEEPAVEEPAVEESAVDEHTADEPADERTADEPDAADESAVEEPTASTDEHQR
jgi:hypothetical protein